MLLEPSGPKTTDSFFSKSQVPPHLKIDNTLFSCKKSESFYKWLLPSVTKLTEAVYTLIKMS